MVVVRYNINNDNNNDNNNINNNGLFILTNQKKKTCIQINE